MTDKTGALANEAYFFRPFFRPNQKQSHANVFDSCANFSFTLTLLYGLHCTFHLLRFNFTFVLLAHLYVFNTWYYCIFSNNTQGSYFKINLGQMAKSRGNRAEVQRGKYCFTQSFWYV